MKVQHVLHDTRWFMKHLPDLGKNSVCIGMGAMVNKPRLQGLIYHVNLQPVLVVGGMIN